MLVLNDRFARASALAQLKPRMTVAMYFDDTQTDVVYFTSHDDIGRPEGAIAVDGVLENFSGGTQKVDPKNSTSSIGSVSFDLLDRDGIVSTLLAERFAEGKSPRHKKIVFYYGFGEYTDGFNNATGDELDESFTEFSTLDWLDYVPRFTMVVNDYSWQDGVVSFTAEDVQRLEITDIFVADTTNLTSTITAEQLVIPCALTITSDTFQTIEHDYSYSDRPGETVQYIQIGNEVICHNGLIDDSTYGVSFNVLQRGALNTLAVAHEVDSSAQDDRKTPITEFIYLEGPALKLLYAIQTGILYDQGGAMLPEHWTQAIPVEYVRLSDYLNAGPLLWDTSTNTGRKLRFEGYEKIDGAKFIETEILPWLSGFRPVYNDGSIGFKKLSTVLSGASYVFELNDDNIISFGKFNHALSDVINDISIEWDYSFQKEEYLQTSRIIDAQSISKYSTAKAQSYSFKGVKSSNQTDQDLRNFFDGLRNRYSAGGIKLDCQVLPKINFLDVGDIVRIKSNTVRDPITGLELDRVFEIQQVTPNQRTGNMGLQLFASAEAAGEFEVISNGTVLTDDFYVEKGRDIKTFTGYKDGELTLNVVFVGGDTMGEGVFYHDGDLTIPYGVTIQLEKNVQFRIKGTFTRNGNIYGVGKGKEGGKGGKLFNQNSQTQIELINAEDDLSTNETLGLAGYFGNSARSNYTYPVTNSLDIYYSAEEFRQGNVYSDPDIITGLNSNVDRLPIRNVNGTIDGIDSLDLQGSSGSGSPPVVSSWYLFTPSNEKVIVNHHSILAEGADGGNSGAGFILICRGESVGVSSTIDLSGEDGEPAVQLTSRWLVYDRGISNGGGGGGSPGAYYLLVDGVGSFGSSSQNITQNYGLSGLNPDSTEVFSGYISGKSWRPDDIDRYTTINFGRLFTPDIDVGEAGFKIQYVPSVEGLEPLQENEPDYQLQPVNSITLTSGTDELLSAGDGSIRERVRVEWLASIESQAESYEIQASQLIDGSAYEWRTVAYIDNLESPIAYFDVNEGFEYVSRVRVIGSDNTIPSEWTTSLAHTAVGKSEAPSDPTGFSVTAQPDVGIVFEVDTHPDTDFLEYRISRGATFDKAIRIFNGNATRFTWEKPTAGEYTFWCVAYDRSRNESTAVSVSQTIVGPQKPTYSVVFEGTDVVINFNALSGSFYVTSFNIYDGDTLIANLSSTQYRQTVNWRGSKTFTITAVDSVGNESASAEIMVLPIFPVTPSISAQTVDNQVQLRYSSLKGSLPIDHYELRVGADFDRPDKTEIKAGTSSFTQFFEDNGGLYTYWLFAVDTAGNSGDESFISVYVDDPTDFVLLEQYTESENGLPGVLSNGIKISNDDIFLPVNHTETWSEHFTKNGYTTPNDQVDAGKGVYLLPSVSSGYYERTIDTGVTITESTITVTPTLKTITGNPINRVNISYSLDNVTFIDGSEGITKLYAANFRYIKFRVTVGSSGNNDLAQLVDVTTRLNIKYRYDQGKATSISTDSDGTHVTFNKSFLDVDYIGITPYSDTAVTFLLDFDDVPNPVGFNVKFFNANTGARATVNFGWTTTGK